MSNLDLGATDYWDSWYGPSGRDGNSTVHDLFPLILNSRAAKAMIGATGSNFNESRIKELQTEADLKCSKPSDPIPCDPYQTPCLFNINDDPCEFNNLAAEYPEMVDRLLLLISEYNRTALTPIPRITHGEAAPSKWGYLWTNWKDFV